VQVGLELGHRIRHGVSLLIPQVALPKTDTGKEQRAGWVMRRKKWKW